MRTTFSNNFQLNNEFEIYDSIRRSATGIIAIIILISWTFSLIYFLDLFEHGLKLVEWLRFSISLLIAFYSPYILSGRKGFFNWLDSWEQSMLKRKMIDELSEHESIVIDNKIFTCCQEYKVVGNKLYCSQISSKSESEEDIRENV